MTQALGAIGIGASIAGGITSAAGAKQTAQAQLQQNNYQAGVAQINANIAKQNRDFALNQGEQQAVKYGLDASQRAGAIKAGQGASGLDVNSGSAVDVRASQKLATDMDLTQIRSNAAKTAYDFDVQSVGFENQSQLYKMAGQNAVAAGNIQATASILGTVGSVSSKWAQGNSLGMFGTGYTA